MQDDELFRMFEIQKKINQNLLNLTLKEKQELTKQFVLALSGEITELLQEINWCSWKKNVNVIESNVHEELVDICKFFLNLCLIWDLDENRLFEQFERKSIVVEQKLKQMESLKYIKEKQTKVCGIDLDGVILKYPDHWIDYINRNENTNFTNIYEVHKNISNKKYLDLKHEYRKSGKKVDIPLNEGACEFINRLKILGYYIVILTKRPYKQYFRLFADTKNCLDKNNIIYDALIFDSEKHKLIIKELPQLEFMVEDNRHIANEVGNWGYKVFLLDNIYNQGDLNENVVRVKSLKEILSYVNNISENSL